MSNVILAAHNIYKTYKLGKHTVEVLKGINLEVQRGEVIVIVGASEAGKSTLLHLFGGLDKPTSGEVFFDQTSLFQLSGTGRTRWRNQQVGFVFQSYHLLPELDALENVCVPSWVSGNRSAAVSDRAKELLQSVGLGQRMDHRPAELSGGEQQRVAIARALMNRPSLLLADEPTGNLDDKSSEGILDLLWKMRADTGATLVMVTHDQHVAKRGERVLEIVGGRIG